MSHSKFILIGLALVVVCAVLPYSALAQESRLPGASDATISGAVLAADGITPLVDAQVTLLDVTGEVVGFRVTGENGRYAFTNIPVGSYRLKAERVGFVEAFSNGSPTLERAEFLPVTGDRSYAIDFALDLPGGISGVVTAADGITPLDSAAVYVYDYASGRSLGLALTTPDGWYSINYLAPGEYLVKAVSMGSVTTYAGGRFNAESAPPVAVTGGAVTQSIDFTMPQAAILSGIVTESDGVTPIARAAVYAYKPQESTPVAWVETHSDGTYALPVPAGSYELRAYQFNHDPRDFNSDPARRDAEQLTVAAGETRTGLAFALAGVGVVSGSVYQPDGVTPAASVSVLLYDSPTADIYTYATSTNLNGTFSRSVLEGTYYFSAISPSFGSVFFNQTMNLGAAVPVSVPASMQTDGIVMTFFSPADAGTLDGSVTFQRSDPKPNPAWSMLLDLRLTPTGALAPIYLGTITTDVNGVFSLPGIPPGDYEVRVKHSHSLANAAIVTVASGGNTLDLGTLREGDANNDNVVNISDFSILAGAFGTAEGQQAFAPQADFNEDNAINITDFSLLAASFGDSGAP